MVKGIRLGEQESSTDDRQIKPKNQTTYSGEESVE